jgi:hypothetical protein
MRIVSLCLICLAALLVVGQPSMAISAGTATIVLNPGENWIATPMVAFDPTPASVFQGVDIANNLTYFDPIQQKTIVYDPSHPTDFPNILMGDGYTINIAGSAPVTISYGGVNVDDTSEWISLPGSSSGGGGMNWIGVSYTAPVRWADIIVTNGSESHSVAVAAQLGWLAPVWTTMNSATQTIEHAGATGQLGADINYLRPGQMYKVETYRSNLALVWQPVPEPSGLPTLFCASGGLIAALRRARRRK